MKSSKKMQRRIAGASLALAGVAFAAFAIRANAQTMQAPDITKTPTLYVVPYAHLDTQWRWEFPQTISEYLLKTMRVNFDLIDKYPHYVFNWTGRQPLPADEGIFPERLRQDEAVRRRGPLVSGGLVDGRGRRQPAQRGSASSARCSTATPISATSSARPAKSTCCRIASAFRPRCPAFWRTPG